MIRGATKDRCIMYLLGHMGIEDVCNREVYVRVQTRTAAWRWKKM